MARPPGQPCWSSRSLSQGVPAASAAQSPRQAPATTRAHQDRSHRALLFGCSSTSEPGAERIDARGQPASRFTVAAPGSGSVKLKLDTGVGDLYLGLSGELTLLAGVGRHKCSTALTVHGSRLPDGTLLDVAGEVWLEGVYPSWLGRCWLDRPAATHPYESDASVVFELPGTRWRSSNPCAMAVISPCATTSMSPFRPRATAGQ